MNMCSLDGEPINELILSELSSFICWQFYIEILSSTKTGLNINWFIWGIKYLILSESINKNIYKCLHFESEKHLEIDKLFFK